MSETETQRADDAAGPGTLPVAAAHALARAQSALFGTPEHAVYLARYTLIRRLGHGGSGTVYLAYDPRLDRKVAIKVLDGDTSLGRLDDAHARILREAQAMARSPHPNVVTVHDVDTYAWPGAPAPVVFIVMEYIDGRDLRQWMERKRRPWRRVVEVFVAAGRGLAAAHAVGVVHRDFKPANVMISRDGSVRVLDFGLARGTGTSADRLASQRDGVELDSPLTVEGTLLGTPAYMAPEQHAGALVDARTDQYSFCVSVWEGIHGERPFAGRTAKDLALAKQNERPTVPARRDVPGWLSEALSRGLDPDPDRRWPSMQELIVALEAGLARRRRWVRGSALGLAAVAAAGLAWASSGARDRLCTGASARAMAVWHPARRTEIAQAFTAATSQTDTNFERVSTAIDGYANRWMEEHRDACEATHVRGEQSERFMELRMHCLDQQLEQLDALLTVLEGADAETAVHAVRAVAELSPPQRCRRTDAVAVDPPPPSDPRQLATVESLRAELGAVEALERAGRFAPARERVLAVVERAQEVDYPPVFAEALARRGSLEARTGAYEETTKTLEQAHAVALASGHDRIAAQAASELASVQGESKGDHVSGLRWIDIAAAELERARGGEDARAALQVRKSTLLRLSGDFDGAHHSALEALALLGRSSDTDPLLLASVHASLGQIMGELDEMTSAREHFEQALALNVAVLGTDHPDIADSHMDLGVVSLAADALPEAAAAFRRSIEIRERALGPSHPTLSPSLSNLGITLRRQGYLAQARHAYERALAIERGRVGGTGPWLTAALNGLGMVTREEGDLDAALEWFERAHEEMVITRGADHPNVARVAFSLGETLAMRGEHTRAVAQFERALELLTPVLEPTHERLGEIRLLLARSLWALDRPDRARAVAREGRDALAEDAAIRAEIETWLAGAQKG